MMSSFEPDGKTVDRERFVDEWPDATRVDFRHRVVGAEAKRIRLSEVGAVHRLQISAHHRQQTFGEDRAHRHAPLSSTQKAPAEEGNLAVIERQKIGDRRRYI